MRNRLIGLALAAALGAPALGADFIPLKAPAPAAAPACTINYCVGAYAGLGVSGNATNVNIFANGIAGSLNAGGTTLDGHLGYRAYNGKFYLGAEISAGYDVSFGTSATGVSPSDRFSGMEIVKLGGSLGSLLGPQQTFTFPAALQPYFESFYINVGAKQRLNANGIVSGAGAEFVIGARSTVNLDLFNVQYGSGGATASSAPGLAIPSENIFRLSYNYNFYP